MRKWMLLVMLMAFLIVPSVKAVQSGDIAIENMMDGSVAGDVSSGDIAIEDVVVQRLSDVNASSGDIEIDFGKPRTVITAGSTDITPPVVNISAPSDTQVYYNNLSLDLNVSADEEIDMWLYELNYSSNVSFTPNTTFSVHNGSYSLTVYANDTSGNMGSDTITFYIDLTLCLFAFNGTVTDMYTDLNVDGVKVELLENNAVVNFTYTNTSGYYLNTYCNHTGNLEELSLRFTHWGFPIEERIPRSAPEEYDNEMVSWGIYNHVMRILTGGDI